jgi:hypothetical protein
MSKAGEVTKLTRRTVKWLAHLLRHGLIRPSFIPPKPVRNLRDLTRRCRQLLQDATSERNRVQKILEDANVKLASVLADPSVFPVNSCWKQC